MSVLWKETLAAVKVADELATSNDLNSIQNDLHAILKSNFRNPLAKIYLFGARTMRLGTKNSNLDIYVDTGNNFYDFSEQPSTRVTMELSKLITGLKKMPNIWKIVEQVDGKVPIVTVVHKQTSIKCDINVSHAMGYAQNQIVKYIFQLQPIGRYMCICLRKIFELNKIDEDFRYHITILMVIFFLQTRKLLPSIKYLQRYNNICDMGPWMSAIIGETLAYNGTNINLNAEELKKWIEGFFKYYGNFDYSNVISPFLGQAFSKNVIAKWLPRRYQSLFGSNNGLDLHRSILVQDFIQLNQNKAQLISDASLNKFKKVCKKYEIIY